MYLSGMQLVNFRNFKSTNFIFEEGANTIIGENDAGKSNAISGLRLLLDDSSFYNSKRLKESDFSYALENWKGHWIILSATFSKISDIDKQSEVCASLVIDDNESVDLVSALISSDDREHGVVTLFIRPQKSIRKQLFDASGDIVRFTEIRNSIRLSDYEFYFTSKSKADFSNDAIYKQIVGDIESSQVSDPEEDDLRILGQKISIPDVHSHISLVYIDALRDVLREMHTPRNPIRRIVEAIESNIASSKVAAVKEKIKELNESITNIDEISTIGSGLNKKLLDILGVIYSPEINLSSELSDELNSLSRFIAMKSKNENDLDLLGLGHLNMIYLALKIVEFETCRSRELLNIMVVEEPEAHIHSHIQKTLFSNLSVAESYTQIIMTTHSTHLAESSEISRMNILKTSNQTSVAMQPVNMLDEYGASTLNKRCLPLTKCIERYFDAKRNVLLFSKGVMLVEGDAEEILIPNVVKAALGISLDEIGIGLVNVGSTAFEYVASVFDNHRIQRHCAIITDLDKQAVAPESSFYVAGAEAAGESRRAKLEKLHSDNPWVKAFYAEHTFEIEFTNTYENYIYWVASLDKIYTQETRKRNIAQQITGAKTRNHEVLRLANNEGKGWMATILAEELDTKAGVPDYIVSSIAFAAQETMSLQIYIKMIKYALTRYDNTAEIENYNKKLSSTSGSNEIVVCIKAILNDHFFKDDAVRGFINACEEHNVLLGDSHE